MVRFLGMKLGHLFQGNIFNPQTPVEGEILVIATCLFPDSEDGRPMSSGLALQRSFLFGLLCHSALLFLVTETKLLARVS